MKNPEDKLKCDESLFEESSDTDDGFIEEEDSNDEAEFDLDA